MNTLELMEPETETRALNGEDIIRMPYGLLGFENVNNYALLTRPNEEPFLWLQMLDGERRAMRFSRPFPHLSRFRTTSRTSRRRT